MNWIEYIFGAAFGLVVVVCVYAWMRVGVYVYGRLFLSPRYKRHGQP